MHELDEAMTFPDAQPLHTVDDEVALLRALSRVTSRAPAVASQRPPTSGECTWITADDWRVVSFHDGDGPHSWDCIARLVSPEGRVFAFPFHSAALNNFQPEPSAWIWRFSSWLPPSEAQDGMAELINRWGDDSSRHPTLAELDQDDLGVTIPSLLEEVSL